METINTQILQTEYDQLVEERLAFNEAGMKAKVQEWDYKIKVCEAKMKYPVITFDQISNDLGIAGLNKVLDERKKETSGRRTSSSFRYCRSCYGSLYSC